MNVTTLFSKQLIETNLSVSNQTELFHYADKRLRALNFVTPEFLPALIQREKVYPTGLLTTSGAVAIPHTDPKHIKEPFIYVLKLATGISFGQMGTDLADKKVVYPNLIFLIGYRQNNWQLTILSTLIALFGQSDKMAELLACQDSTELYHVLQKQLRTS